MATARVTGRAPGLTSEPVRSDRSVVMFEGHTSGTDLGTSGRPLLLAALALVLVVAAAVIALAASTSHAATDTTSGDGSCDPDDTVGVVFVIDDSGSNAWTDPHQLRDSAV